MDNPTLALIKARAATKKSQEEEHRLATELRSQELKAAFAPIVKMWQDVQHLSFKAYRFHERGTVPAIKRLATGGHTVTTSISFYGGTGNEEWSLWAEHSNTGLVVYQFSQGRLSQARTLTLEQAKSVFIEFLAEALAPEALK